MRDAICMQKGNASKHLLHDHSPMFLAKSPAILFEQSFQITLTELSDEIDLIFGLKLFNHSQQIRVAETGQDLELSP